MSLKLRFVVGSSSRLRDEALAPLLAEWTGTVKRAADPADLRSILVDIDTPSLFGEPTLWLVRGGEAWVKQKAADLQAMVGQEAAGGALIVVTPGIDGRTPLAKALPANPGTVHPAGPPWEGLRWGEATAACKAWIAERLAAHPAGVQRPVLCADRLYAHCGEDADAILAAIDVLLLYADETAVTPEGIDAVVVGAAERPVWEFSAAVLGGDASKAIALLHAGQGIDPPRALATLIGEIRKQLACLAADDDATAAAIAGMRGRPNLRMARRQAQGIGRGPLVRLLGGAVRTQRLLRTGGTDHALELEVLVLHARQLLAAGRR